MFYKYYLFSGFLSSLLICASEERVRVRLPGVRRGVASHTKLPILRPKVCATPGVRRGAAPPRLHPKAFVCPFEEGSPLLCELRPNLPYLL